jgi:hypothetical protein
MTTKMKNKFWRTFEMMEAFWFVIFMTRLQRGLLLKSMTILSFDSCQSYEEANVHYAMRLLGEQLQQYIKFYRE